MKQGQNARKPRGRPQNRKPMNQRGNQTGGPKVRGNPKQQIEKYNNAARDALQEGDRVKAEYYYQFADHYQRILNEVKGPAKDPQPRDQQPRDQQPRDQQPRPRRGDGGNRKDGGDAVSPANGAEQGDAGAPMDHSHDPRRANGDRDPRAGEEAPEQGDGGEADKPKPARRGRKPGPRRRKSEDADGAADSDGQSGKDQADNAA